MVALLAEGVDRNKQAEQEGERMAVALLAEGVDRNSRISMLLIVLSVALLAEGVDRNVFGGLAVFVSLGRPPRGGRG